MKRNRITMLLALVLVLCAIVPSAYATETEANAAPKYIFMFIGDGQGSPQITATQYYLGTLSNPDSVIPIPEDLSFTAFPYTGIMTTYDATSFFPDSASTATSMVSGEKTLSGVLNYNIDQTEAFDILTEYVKKTGMKVGVVSTVSLDHATPAAYYAKVPSRNQYYDIAVQGLTGDVLDFLGGGRFLQPTGSDGDQKDLYELAEENGFTIVDTAEDIRNLTSESGRVLALAEDPDDSMAMQYEVDRLRKIEQGEDSLSLAELVEVAINVLDNEDGFYLMAEGGKVDWSCHANDAKTSIMETIAFADAVQVAVDFANEHPDETLIIVTGDHETGGLTIGFAATAYDTHFLYLENQDISFTDFDYVIDELRDNGADFETAMEEVERHYGLTLAADQDLSISETEREALESAYVLNMIPSSEREIGEAEELAYGGYEPFSMAVSHVLNNKVGIAFTSYAHTGLQIPVYAMGVGAENFSGSYDNTDIFFKTMDILGLSY